MKGNKRGRRKPVRPPTLRSAFPSEIRRMDSIPSGQTHRIQILPEDVSVVRRLEMLKPHDHLCLIYESKEEWRATVVPFISIGLRQGEKCIYVVDTSTVEEIRNRLLDKGVDVASAEKSG